MAAKKKDETPEVVEPDETPEADPPAEYVPDEGLHGNADY